MSTINALPLQPADDSTGHVDSLLRMTQFTVSGVLLLASIFKLQAFAEAVDIHPVCVSHLATLLVIILEATLGVLLAMRWTPKIGRAAKV